MIGQIARGMRRAALLLTPFQMSLVVSSASVRIIKNQDSTASVLVGMKWLGLSSRLEHGGLVATLPANPAYSQSSKFFDKIPQLRDALTEDRCDPEAHTVRDMVEKIRLTPREGVLGVGTWLRCWRLPAQRRPAAPNGFGCGRPDLKRIRQLRSTSRRRASLWSQPTTCQPLASVRGVPSSLSESDGIRLGPGGMLETRRT
jgi:hypothetical protein